MEARMWKVVWILGPPATGKSKLLCDFVRGSKEGGKEVVVAYKAQRYVFSEARKGVFVAGPRAAYADGCVRPGLESGSTAYKGSFHIGVEHLLRTRPSGTLVLDLVAYPLHALETMRRLATVLVLHMPRVSDETLRKRYLERQSRDPRYYKRTYDANAEAVAKRYLPMREWLVTNAAREATATQTSLLPTLIALSERTKLADGVRRVRP